jgi:hypothetical protein
LFGLRAFYFGDVRPNTAFAQGIDISGRLARLWEHGFRATVRLIWYAVKSNGGLGLAVALSLLFVVARGQRVALATGVLALVGTATAAVQLVIFGGARLEDTRTTSFIALYASVALIAMLAALVAKPGRLRATAAVAVAAVLVGPLNATLMPGRTPYFLCCEAEIFEQLSRAAFRRLQIAHDLPRPLVANPDLGVVSFYKEFNVLDAGFLGSEPGAKARGNPEQLSALFLRALLPDFVLLHSDWICIHIGWLRQPRFSELFIEVPSPIAILNNGQRVVSIAVTDYAARGCPRDPPSSVYLAHYVRRNIMRGSNSSERRFVDQLRATPEAALITSEVTRCNGWSELDACMYVIRTVYRFIPELRATGAYSAALQALDGIADPAVARMGRAIINGRNNGRISDALREFSGSPGP